MFCAEGVQQVATARHGSLPPGAGTGILGLNEAFCCVQARAWAFLTGLCNKPGVSLLGPAAVEAVTTKMLIVFKLHRCQVAWYPHIVAAAGAWCFVDAALQWVWNPQRGWLHHGCLQLLWLNDICPQNALTPCPLMYCTRVGGCSDSICPAKGCSVVYQ